MKIQDVKKECLAIVGLSIEFSNSEISSLSHLLTKVSDAIDKGVKTLHAQAKDTGRLCDEKENIPVCIDLKSLKRMEWLLTQLTRNETSGLFESADADYRTEVGHINNIPAVKS